MTKSTNNTRKLGLVTFKIEWTPPDGWESLLHVFNYGTNGGYLEAIMILSQQTLSRSNYVTYR